MNNLEWINDIINLYKKEIKRLKESIKSTLPIHEKAIESLTRNCEEMKEELKTLEQIKEELEAWEICKRNSHINNYNSNNKRFDICIWLNTENSDFKSCASYEECLKVKKALERKDKGENK